MKLILIIAFIVPSIALAQSDTISNIDKFFSESPGAMIKIEYIEIGKFKNGEVRLYKLTNMRKGSSMNYVYIWDYSGDIVNIEMDELQGIVDAIEFLSKISYKEKPVNHEQYNYITKSNVQLYLYNAQSGVQRGWYMGLGEKYKYSNDFKRGRIIETRPSVFDEIVVFLRKAQTTSF